MQEIKELIKRYFIKYLFLAVIAIILPKLLFKMFEVYYTGKYGFYEVDLFTLETIRFGIEFSIRFIFSIFIVLDLMKNSFTHSWLGLTALFSIPFSLIILLIATVKNKLSHEVP